jgi:hypothetical protein
VAAAPVSQLQGTAIMLNNSKASVLMVTAMLSPSHTIRASDCRFPALLNQHRNVATIESLEFEWSRAYLRGDTGFEACLLTADFTEIMRNGQVNHLSD